MGLGGEYRPSGEPLRGVRGFATEVNNELTESGLEPVDSRFHFHGKIDTNARAVQKTNRSSSTTTSSSRSWRSGATRCGSASKPPKDVPVRRQAQTRTYERTKRSTVLRSAAGTAGDRGQDGWDHHLLNFTALLLLPPVPLLRGNGSSSPICRARLMTCTVAVIGASPDRRKFGNKSLRARTGALPATPCPSGHPQRP